MENEFLDLIKTFEKTATRLEKLDTTILGFKGIVENLRGNLDELVEMVQLEQIVELASNSKLKLDQLESQLLNYQQATQRFDNQVDVFAKLVKNESKAMDQKFLYEIDPESKEVLLIQKNQFTANKTIQGLKVKKIFSHFNTTFALSLDGDALYVLKGDTPLSILEGTIDDFVISNYHVYAIMDKVLIKYHLLTQEKEILLKNVKKIYPLAGNKHLLCKNENEESTFLEL